MFRRIALSQALALILIVVFFAGCDDDSTSPNGGDDGGGGGGGEISPFVGSWVVSVNRWSSSGCGPRDFDDTEDLLGLCLTVTVDGSNITIQDSTGRGLLTGTINGNVATLSRTRGDATFTVELTLDGDVVSATASYEDTSDGCSGPSVDLEISLQRLSSACGVTGGPFQGLWNTNVQASENDCGLLPDQNTSCIELRQYGSAVFDIRRDSSRVSGRLMGTASGNTMTGQEEEDTPIGRIISAISVSVLGGGTSLSGTQSIDIISTESSCRAVYDLTGTPTSVPCPPDSRTTPRWETLGS